MTRAVSLHRLGPSRRAGPALCVVWKSRSDLSEIVVKGSRNQTTLPSASTSSLFVSRWWDRYLVAKQDSV